VLTFVLPIIERSCSFILENFLNISAITGIRKNRNHQKFLLMQGYLFKVKLNNPLFCFNLLPPKSV